MGKWIARLRQADSATPPADATDKTPKTSGGLPLGGLLSVLSVPPEGGCAIARSALEPSETVGSMLHMPAIRADLLLLRSRLVRWGWSRSLARRTVGLISARADDDPRRLCPECSNYRPGACATPGAAGMMGGEVGTDLATTLQHCPAYSACPPTHHDGAQPASDVAMIESRREPKNLRTWQLEADQVAKDALIE